jgi:hypothetical protein
MEIDYDFVDSKGGKVFRDVADERFTQDRNSRLGPVLC